jgi:DNA-binding NtrC family response regulator
MPAVKPSILVVDDDPDTCQNLSDILADLGYHVLTAQDGFAARELVRKNSFDVALLDFKMPGMDGLELNREIRRISPSTVTLIISAYVTPAETEEALRAGTWKVLSKPMDLGTVLPLVDEALTWPVVLLVDDDREFCNSLWDVLHERGFRLGLAHTVAEGATQLGRRQFEVVLLDLVLPQGNALDVLQVLHQANPDAKAILITGHRELDAQIAAVLADGAAVVCYKPFDLDQLLGTLGQFTGAGQDLERPATAERL